MQQSMDEQLYEELSMLTGVLSRQTYQEEHGKVIEALSKTSKNKSDKPESPMMCLMWQCQPKAAIGLCQNKADIANSDEFAEKIEDLYQELAASTGMLSVDIFMRELRPSLIDVGGHL